MYVSKLALMKTKKEKQLRKKQLTRREYEKLKRTAYEYAVVQGLDQKDVAKMLGITEQTLSKWAIEGKWKEERTARQQCHSTDADNTKQILRLMSEKRLEIELQIRDASKSNDKEEELRLRKEARSLSDEISKHNKALLSLDKDNRITLGVYVDVFDDIFTALRVFNEELWEKTIDFQTLQIRKKTNELG